VSVTLVAAAAVVAVDGGRRATMAQSEGEAGASVGSEHGSGGGTEPGAVPRLDPKALPTSTDSKRWDTPASRLPPLKQDRAEEGDADVETAHEEAAALRREAAEIRASLERLEAQEKRGARVRSENADEMRRRADELKDQLGDLQRRAGDLDDEAADLHGHDEKGAHDDVLHSDMTEHAVTPDADPLSGDIEDPLDDDDGGDID
jgi:hypothetical protein